MSHRSSALLGGLLLTLSVLAGCATVSAPAEETVARRAQSRFDALVARDYKAAYEFFTPSFREKFDYDTYIRSRPPRAVFLSGKVLKVTCTTDTSCDVEMESSYKSPAGVKAAPKGEVTRVTPERWVKVDGQWWFYQEK